MTTMILRRCHISQAARWAYPDPTDIVFSQLILQLQTSHKQIKIQDGVQDGRQLQRFTMMDLFPQPIERCLWSLGVFRCFSMSWIQRKYIWNHNEHISWWFFNYEGFWCHSSIKIFMKMTKNSINGLEQPVSTCKSICVTYKIWKVNLI